MSWVRYTGRVLLAVGVLVVAYWATANKLIDIPPYYFWLGILSYLVAAEVVWALVERKGQEKETALPRQGLLPLSRWDRGPTSLTWFQDGGRPRLADVVAKLDSHREALLAVQTGISGSVNGLRLHVLAAHPGSGRSTFLFRLGRTLLDAGHPVFAVLPTPELTAIEKILEAARRRQVYVLVDDLDLRPEAEEWLYELGRLNLPIVVIATSSLPRDEAGRDGLEALQPAHLRSSAVMHDITVAHNDLVALSRRLSSVSALQRVGLSLQETDSLLQATRALQGKAERGLWADLDAGPTLPPEQKLMLALVGAAEMGVPLPLWARLFGERSERAWQKAGLVQVDNCLVLPPHRLTCLDLLATADPAAVAGRLRELCQKALDVLPAFAARLLFALAQLPQTEALARAELQRLQILEPPAHWPEAVRRLWRRALDTVDMLPENAAAMTEYPPEINLLVDSALARHDPARALELARRLLRNPVYQPAARFNSALALAELGQTADAAQELVGAGPSAPGAHYLRGVLAEMNGDTLQALDHYDASRKAGELEVPATRRLAFAYIKSGAPRSAIPLFEAALALQPLDPELYAGLAVAHLHAGMAQRSAAQSARAIQAGVDPITARKTVARACAHSHAYARAAAELEACVSYDATDLETWEGLAVACRWLGRFAREEECLRHLQEGQPDRSEWRLQMARCQRDQGRGQEALETLQPLLTEDAPDLRALVLAAEVAAGCDERGLQEDLARQALRQGDTSGWAYYWLADSQAELNQEARTAYGAALSQLQEQIQAGLTPRRSATLWQAVHLAAAALGQEELAAQAARKASQEAAICEALHAEIDSVAHHRAVPSDLFLQSLPPYQKGGGVPAEPAPEKPAIRPVTPMETSLTRNRRLRPG